MNAIKRTFLLVEDGAPLDEALKELEQPGISHAFHLKSGEVCEAFRQKTQAIDFNFLNPSRHKQLQEDLLAFVERERKANNSALWDSSDFCSKSYFNGRKLYAQLGLIAVLDDLARFSNEKQSGLALTGLNNRTMRVAGKHLTALGYTVRSVHAPANPKSGKLFRIGRYFYRYLLFLRKFSGLMASVKNAGFTRIESKNNPNIILRSYYFANSIQNGQFKDIFFSPLSEHLRKKSTLHKYYLDAANVDQFDGSQLESLKSKGDLTFSLCYLGILDIAWAFVSVTSFVLRTFFRGIFHRMNLSGIDVRSIILEDFSENASLGTFFPLYLEFISASRFFKSTGNSKIIYPYENLAWEKLFVRARNENAPGTRLTAFQHSLFTPIILSARLPKNQMDPQHPDLILSTGKLSKQAMVEISNYPDEFIRVAGALRQRPFTAQGRAIPSGSKIRILLSTSIPEDCEGLLRFVLEAGLDPDKIESIAIRPHPLFGYACVKDLVNRSHNGIPVFIDQSKTISESASKADVILYCYSTSAVECLMESGKPIIHVRLDSLFETDPLHGLNALKRTALHPKNLPQLLADLSQMTPDQYDREKAAAISYLGDYFRSPDEAVFDTFLHNIIG